MYSSDANHSIEKFSLVKQHSKSFYSSFPSCTHTPRERVSREPLVKLK